MTKQRCDHAQYVLNLIVRLNLKSLLPTISYNCNVHKFSYLSFGFLAFSISLTKENKRAKLIIIRNENQKKKKTHKITMMHTNMFCFVFFSPLHTSAQLKFSHFSIKNISFFFFFNVVSQFFYFFWLEFVSSSKVWNRL